MLAALLPGCVSLGGKKAPPEQAPVGPVHQVQALWQNRVITAADVVHKGSELPGLAGRVYLLGEDLGNPVKAKGKLLVDVYDFEHPGADGQLRLLEHYEFPDSVMNQLLRKDTWIGWGYTVFLPWPEYRPDIKRVQVKVCFAPEGGTSVFAVPTKISLRGDPHLTMERVVPVNAQDMPPQGAQIPMRVSVPAGQQKN